MKTARVYTESLDFTRGKLRRSGFTLIELLVVIAIITVLASIGLTIYSNAQKTARISKRVQDLKAIEAALEIYYNANNSAYPTTAPATFVCLNTLTGVNSLTPNYMVVIPDDPAGTSYCYRYQGTVSDYKVMTNTTLPTSEMSDSDFRKQTALIDPRRDGAPGDTDTACDTAITGSITAWAIYTTGARCW